jgi:methyl-accepting chemotaxis protein
MSSVTEYAASMAAQSPATDTVFMVAPRDGLATAEAVSAIVVAVGLVLLFLLAAILVLQIRRLSKNLERNAGPALDRARSVAENVDFITASVRTDIQKLNESVGQITDRLNQASDRGEERVEDFNALIEVVQAEAEDIFLDTASTVRGVRAGAKALGNGEESADGTPALEAGSASPSDHPEEVEEEKVEDETPEDAVDEDEAEGKEG